MQACFQKNKRILGITVCKPHRGDILVEKQQKLYQSPIGATFSPLFLSIHQDAAGRID